MADRDGARAILHSLGERLSDRQSELLKYQRYYDGDHPMAFATAEFREEFGRILEDLRDNYCRLVPKAKSERMIVTGFLVPGDNEDGAADDEAWRIWQANRMDAQSRMAHDEALVKKVAYATVWPNQKDPPTPRIAVESPLQTIVDYEPGDRTSRLSALKRWKGADKHLYATVYLPDGIWKFRTESPIDQPDDTPREKVEWVERGPMVPNPFGVVPVVPLPNDPELLTEGRSELADAIPIQDAINKLWHDLIVSSEFGAYVQRLLTGVEAPIDPETRQPLKGWKPEVSRIMTTANPEARGFAFEATDLDNFIKAIDRAVQSLAIKTRTPPHYLNTSADRLSGESLKSSETGLTSSVKEKLEYFGEGWEEVMRLAFRMVGDDAKAEQVDLQTLWRNPEIRSEAEAADRASKLSEIGVPFRQLVRDLGYSEQEIKRILQWRRQEQLEAQAVDLSDLDADPEQPEPSQAA